jgi:signal transduction histidine kinase
MQARIAEYVRERTAMVAAIAHDLRTPLARIAFRIEGAPEAVRDPVQRRLFQNLIDNALAFAGRATVETAREPGTLVVRVADRGPGCRTTCWSACSSRFVVTSLHATAPRAASDSG